MDTVGQYFRLFVFGYTSYLLCYGFVGKKHKFFYQFIGVFRLFEIHTDRFPFLVNFEFHLVAVKIDCSRCEPFFAECFRDGVQHKYFFFVVTFFSFNNLLRLFVSETAVGIDDCMRNA